MLADLGRTKRRETLQMAPLRPTLQIYVANDAKRPAPVHPPSSPASSISSDESLPSPSTFVRPRLNAQPRETSNRSPARPQQPLEQLLAPPSELDGHEWPFEGVLAERSAAEGMEYLAKWEDSTLDARHVQARGDGSRFVRCDGRDWEILAVIDAQSPQDGAVGQHVKVTWDSTWRHEDDLTSKSNNIRSFIWRLAATEGEDAQSQVGDKRVTLPERFMPEAGLDYGPALRRFFREHPRWITGEIVPLLMQAPAIRPTTIRKKFAANRKDFNLGRQEKHQAMLSYSSALEQDSACGRCAAGFGPFPICAVSLNTGACVNCMFDATGPSCDFHARGRSCISHPRAEYPTDHSRRSAQTSTRATKSR